MSQLQRNHIFSELSHFGGKIPGMKSGRSLSKIEKPVKSSKKPANEQVQRQFLKTSKKPVMYQCKV